MTFDITTIVEAIITLGAAIITVFVVPYIKSKTTDTQRAQIEAWTKIAVAAAEQIFTGDGRGQEKKQYVLDFLASKGLRLDVNAVETLIEAAVFDLKQKAGE